MFHQPIQTCMENISTRDAGFGLINTLDIPEGSDFWRKAYNMGGGPGMRCSAYGFMNEALKLGGISRVKAVMERNWFATRNFHMQYYEDSHITNAYLNYWRDSLDDWLAALSANMPLSIKLVRWLADHLPIFQTVVEKTTYQRMLKMVEDHKNGTRYWIRTGNDLRVSAFFKDYQTYQAIPGWEVDLPELVPDLDWTRLDHGYDEEKDQLDLDDLINAAKFRGGECHSTLWNGDMYQTLKWKCARGHGFEGKPYTILKAGHWCPDCVPPPWDFDQEARVNPLYPNHLPDENNFYPEDCLGDIAGADREKS
jgi:hypothetical protein